MVIDVDDELILEISDIRPRDVGTFDDENRVVPAVDLGDANDVRGSGKNVVGAWKTVADNDFGVFSKRPKQPAKPE